MEAGNCADGDKGVINEHKNRKENGKGIDLIKGSFDPGFGFGDVNRNEGHKEGIGRTAYESVNNQKILLRKQQFIAQKDNGRGGGEKEKYKADKKPAKLIRGVAVFSKGKFAFQTAVLPCDGKDQHKKDNGAADYGNDIGKNITAEHRKGHSHKQAQNISQNNIAYSF